MVDIFDNFKHDNAPLPQCDRTKPSDQSPWPHNYEHHGYEYASLIEGGSYEILKCQRCGRIAYQMLPD